MGWPRVFEKRKKEKLVSPFTSPKEKVFLDAVFLERIRLKAGAKVPEFVRIKDDGSGLLKETSKEGAKRERAAYLIDRFLGFNFVPPTVLRGENGEWGTTLQEFIEDSETASTYLGRVKKEGKLPIPKSQLVKLQIFDSIILNWDRHNQNYLVKDQEVFAIDNELSLPKSESDEKDFFEGILKDILGLLAQGERIPEDVVKGLKNFQLSREDQNLLEDLLEELLESGVVSRLMKRLLSLTSAITDDGGLDGSKILNL